MTLIMSSLMSLFSITSHFLEESIKSTMKEDTRLLSKRVAEYLHTK